MSKIRNVVSHSIIHDFWVVLSKDPDNKLKNMAHPKTELNIDVSGFFRVMKPVNTSFQLR